MVFSQINVREKLVNFGVKQQYSYMSHDLFLLVPHE